LAISVIVRTFTEEILSRSVHPGIGALCQSARERHLPLLSGVDPYDNTVFNRLQVRDVRAELDSLRDAGDFEDLVLWTELVELIELVNAKPHRYLLFSGD
jgi:hypothetical protein